LGTVSKVAYNIGIHVSNFNGKLQFILINMKNLKKFALCLHLHEHFTIGFMTTLFSSNPIEFKKGVD